MKRIIKLLLAGSVATALWLTLAGPAQACGGFFCQTSPVDQAAERIVFTVNDDDTVSSLIEIAYTGAASDFSWILPIPEPIAVDDIVVPDGGENVFDELHRWTDTIFVDPDPSECALDRRNIEIFDGGNIMMDASMAIQVFASGEVGPFGFDVIGAEDPTGLITWLRDNDYRVDPSMEPLIDLYVEEGFSFIAMRLLDGESSESISPVEITYPGTQPMIPLRLTAVAASPQMPIYVWIFGDKQAVPKNYEHFEIATAEITFSGFGLNDYPRLVQDRADAVGGRGFITEFAGPADSLAFNDPYLVERAADQPYLTRLFTNIDPDEMLVDPVFEFDTEAADVSTVRDARGLQGLYDCDRNDTRLIGFDQSDAVDPNQINIHLRELTRARQALEDSGYPVQDEAASAGEIASGPSIFRAGQDHQGASTLLVVTLTILGTLFAGAVATATFGAALRSDTSAGS